MDQITLALAKNYTDEQIRKSSTGEMLIDKTLSKEGYAADAKAVGDALVDVKASDVFVKTEDGEKLPAEIEIDLNDDIPALVVAPLTAKVGQALVVDSVNESGKPAAWKAVDFPVGGGGGGGNVHFESQDFTIPEDSKGVEIQLPVSVKNLIMYNLVIVRPTYTPGVDKCRLFALHGGNNIEFACTTCTGSTNITGFRYGRYIGATISTRPQDTYYEHTVPSIGATGKTLLGDGDKISLLNMTDGIVFPAGTRIMFWVVYFQ